jgi:hypothetical protein
VKFPRRRELAVPYRATYFRRVKVALNRNYDFVAAWGAYEVSPEILLIAELVVESREPGSGMRSTERVSVRTRAAVTVESGASGRTIANKTPSAQWRRELGTL